MFPKTQVIVNPESNKGRTRRRWLLIKEALRSHFKDFRYEFTEKPLQAIDLTREAIKSGSELIISVGGDGTVNEIANGFYEDRRIINPETTLGIVPSGTGCDLIKSLNIPTGLKDSMKIIAESGSSRIDVGRATFTGPDGQNQERFFLNVADFGLEERSFARSTARGSSVRPRAIFDASTPPLSISNTSGCVSGSTARTFPKRST